MNAKVDAYIKRSQKWPEEMNALRPILLGGGLDEAIKWGKPCYSHDGKNIVILQEMNDFLAAMFFKGMLLDDPNGVLREQGPNSRSARRIEFTSVDDVRRHQDVVKAFIEAALDVEEAGLEVGPAPPPEFAAELRERMGNDEAFAVAFEGLTPGRQREYNMHFSDAKQAATRRSRVEKAAEKILQGKGLRDR